MYDVVTFGEAMIQLAPLNFRRLEQSTSFEVTVGGSELSVAAGTSRLDLKSAWVSRLPDNPLGRMIRNKAWEFGVDTHIIWASGERVGFYTSWNTGPPLGPPMALRPGQLCHV